MKLTMPFSLLLAMNMASLPFRAVTGLAPRALSLNSRVLSSSQLSQKVRLFSTTEEAQTDTPIEESSKSIYDVQAEALAKVESTFIKTMRDRGFLHQCTNLVELDKALMEKTKEGGALAAYLGFDATADSLHVGSLLQIMILRHLQKSGHKPIVLIGGGTSKVGDPTGKDESRKLLTDDVILQNTQGISKVFEKFLKFGDESPSDALMVNNDDWLSSLKYLEFLRDYGTQFTINRMLSFESVKQRLSREAPFSFLEFNYMILQAYDFLELNRRHGAKLQLGGSDQWGNIVAGTELGRRCDGVQLFGLTAPLITTSDGKKMGKTANGAVWLNADRLSEYDYWQFWRNTADDDVIRFMKLFTELPLEQIEELSKLEGADINRAKIVLADETTALLHGRDCLKVIHETVDNMFKNVGGGSTESLPRIFVSSEELKGDGVKFADLFVNLKLASSKKEARRLIQGGGAKIGEDKISDENACLTIDDFGGEKEVTLRAGKKRAGVVEVQ
jgi:tyrosyl-tRNA synthetase